MHDTKSKIIGALVLAYFLVNVWHFVLVIENGKALDRCIAMPEGDAKIHCLLSWHEE